MSSSFVPNILKRGSSNATANSLTFSLYRTTNTINIGDKRYFIVSPVAAATMDLVTNQVSSTISHNGAVAPTATPPIAIKIEPETPPPSPPDALAKIEQVVPEDVNLPLFQEETIETVAQVSSSPIHGGLGVAQLSVYESVRIRSPPKTDRIGELKEIIKARAKNDPTIIRRLLTPARRQMKPTNRDRIIAIDLIKYGFAKSDRGAAEFAGVTTYAIREWKKNEHLIRAADPDSVHYRPAEPRNDEEIMEFH